MAAPVVVPVARVVARPFLAAVARQLAKLEPLAARVAAMLSKIVSGFKDLVAKTFTIEKIQAAIGKVTPWVTVSDALSRLGVSLAKVKGQVVEAATGFGLFGQDKASPQEVVQAAAAPPPLPPNEPPSQQVTLAVDGGGAAGTIQNTGEAAEKAVQKVLTFQGVLSGLGELGFSPAATAAKAFGSPLEAISATIEGLAVVTKTASNFDQLKLSLETLIGSSEHAGQAFQMLVDFAGRTPFSLESSTEAFRQLWTAGIKPTEENLTAFGNVAAAFGKDITAVTSAISDVDLGKLDGLEDLDLQVEKQGEQLKVTFQGVTTTIGNSSQAVAAYLEQLGTTRFADGIDRQANTFAAGFDRVKEAFAALLAAIGGAGLLTALESMDESFAKIVTAAMPVAELLGKGLGAAMTAAATAAEFLAEHAGIVASLLAGLSAAAAVAALGQLVGTLATAKTAVLALGQAIIANPIGLLVAALAAATAAMIIYKDEMVTVGGTTATVGEWMQSTWELLRSRIVDTAKILWEEVTSAWDAGRELLVGIWEKLNNGIAAASLALTAIFLRVQSSLGGLVSIAADLLSSLGGIIGVVFDTLATTVKDVINLMIGSIGVVPRAIGAAVAAIAEGDFDGAFGRMRDAVKNSFSTDFLGNLGRDIQGKVSEWTDVFHFFVENVKNDLSRIESRAGELAANRPAPPPEDSGLPDPSGRHRPGRTGGTAGSPAPPSYDAEIQAAMEAAQRNAALVKEAFDALRTAPVEEMAQKYGAFEAAATTATEEINRQKEALKALGAEHPAVAQALAALDEKLQAIGAQNEAGRRLKEIADGFGDIAAESSSVEAALRDLDAASLSDVLDRTEDVEKAMVLLDKAIADQQRRLAELTEGSVEYVAVQEALEEALDARGKRETRQADVMAKVSDGTREALKAIKAFSAAQSAGFKVEQLVAYLAAIEKIKKEIAALRELRGKLQPGTEGHDSVQSQVAELQGQLATVERDAAVEGIQPGTGGFEDTVDQMGQIWDKFVSDAVGSFEQLFLGVLEGNVDSFDDFVDSIKKLFNQMLAEMAAKALKQVINIPVTVGGEGKTGDKTGGGFSLGDFRDSATGKLDWSGLLGKAFMGYSIGSLVGSFVGKDDNYAELGAQILGVVGAIIGNVYGAIIGAVVGALIGSLIKRGLPKTSATLTVSDGQAQVEEFFSRNSGNLDQIRQYAEGVVEGINELARLTDGVLLDLPDISLSIKNNKFFRVIDASGISHSFGEDYEAAINYAVLLAIKGAKFEGLSPEVEAAIRNSKATTIEDLAADIEFGKEVADIDLEPVTKDLRDVIRRFTEMRERAKDLGISLDKVDKAFSKAVNAIKEDILSGLKPFQEAGLTDVEREARRITEAFAEMRENARLFNEELETQRQARNEDIAELQQELARQQELLAAVQKAPAAFLPPELVEQFAAAGLDIPELLLQGVTGPIEEAIKKLIDEIARLQGLNDEQTPIDTGAIDDAERQARRALRERVRDSLNPYLRLNLTDVERQLAELDDTFEKLRRDARAAGVSMREVDTAYQRAREAIRQQVMDQLQPYLDLADGLTPLQVELRELDERFDDMRKNAAALGIDLKDVDRAEQAARDQLRKQFEDELAAFGGENPFVAQLDDLKDKFEELRKNAIALGLGTDEVNAAYGRALDNLQRQFQDGIQGYLDYGRGLSDLAVRHRDLTRFFDEQREAARALDEAQGGTVNQDLLAEAEQAAFQQLVDDFKASLQDLRDAGLSPTEIAVRDMRDRFEQLRGDAVLLGQSLEELTRLEIEALERLRGELDSRLDRYLLSDEEQQQRALEDEFFNYLREAFALYTYEPGGEAPPEPEIFPGASELELAFDDVKTASQELARAFRELHGAMVPGSPYAPGGPNDPNAPGPEIDPMAPGAGATPGELVASLLDFLKPLREGRGMEGVPAEQQTAIDAAATQVSLLLEQLRLGMTDDVGALQGALANLTTLLQESGVEMDESLLALTETLATGDIPAFLEELRDGVLGSADGFAGLIDILLSGSGMSLADLMHQLATGTFDAVQAMLGLTEIPPELAEVLKNIGLAYEAAQREVRTRGNAGIDRGGDANREVEQRERDLENLLRQLEQFEDLALSPLQRDLKKLNEQFDEMRANARRLGVSLDRVEAAYQLALEERRNTFLEQLRPYEELDMSPAERELAQLNKQFDEMRANALLLGVSLDRVETAYQQAIDDFWERLLGPLHEFREGLELSELSTLTPQERLAEAQARFQDLAARALAGDLEAAQQLQGAAQTLLQEGRSFYASGEGYQDLFALVTGTVDQILATLAPGLFPPPPALAAGAAGMAGAAGFDALLAAAGWGYQDSLAARGIPFATYPGDTLGLAPGEVPLVPAVGATDRPSLAVDLSGTRQDNAALREELRLARQQEHADALELHKRVDQQSEELREVRALLRRLTSNTQYGGRAQ